MTTDSTGNGFRAVPNDLPSIERMCEQLYTAQDSSVRHAAESTLLSLSTSPRHLSQCTMILENSESPWAQKFAAFCLIKLVTSFWSQISTDERVQLRNYILNYLANKGPQLKDFVRLELSTLLCRVTKFGWNDGETHKSIVDDVSRFLDATPQHCIIGLQILARLVSDMNVTIPGIRRTITHSQSRKISLSFRDLVLLKIFNISLQTLTKLHQQTQQNDHQVNNKLRSCGLQLAHACLSFDFVGSSLDDSNEDIGTLHPPSSWNTVIEDSSTVKLFVDIYKAQCTLDSNQSSKALECLVQLVSMRRTLFSTDELRIMNIHRHMKATLEILQQRSGLDDHNNYHHFCRWLARLKVNYQLDEIVSLEIYQQWIELVSNFTLQSLVSDWSWIGESLFYLLSLWSKLISAMPYSKSGKESYLDRFVPKIVEQYITSRLMSLSQVEDDDDDEGDEISEHLELMPVMTRLDYDKTANYIISIMDPMLENYKQFVATGGVGANPSQVSKLERELAWLVRLIGAILSTRLSASTNDTQEMTDGELSARVFQIMVHTVEADTRARSRPGITPEQLATPAGRARNTKGAIALDLAIAEFTQSFRRAFIGEEAVATSKVYVKLSERLGMTDHMIVLDVVASKIACNLRSYGVVDGGQIIAKSLTLLQDLASGYSSSRLLCKLITVREMITNHDEENFPFMKGSDSKMGRHRTIFYQTLLRILFASGGSNFDSENEFIRFMEPLDRKLKALAKINNAESFVNDVSVKSAVIGVLRDLRGVVSTVLNPKTYTLFFEWFYPQHIEVMVKICEVFSGAGVPEVTNVLLKFYSEFVYNKSQRISFGCSSANGILLFREASKILVTYGRHTLKNLEYAGGSSMLQKNSSMDAYRILYKGIWVCLQMFTRSLAGNYVNFGVFELYGDQALKNAMDVCFEMIMVIPVEQVVAYPKVAKAYFGLIDTLSSNHTKDIVSLPHDKFARIVLALREGLQSFEVWMSSQCGTAIDNLSAFRFKQGIKNGELAAQMENHVKQSPDLFSSCLQIIFNMIVNVDCTNQWSLSRPLLSLILTHPDTFLAIQKKTVESQPPDRNMNVRLAFEKLMTDIRQSLDSKNRDLFTSHVTMFRNAMKTEGITELE